MWQNSSEKVTNENEKDICPNIFSNWWSKTNYNNGISKNNEFIKQYIKSTKFRTKNWAEINDDARGTYNTNSQIKFKT